MDSLEVGDGDSTQLIQLTGNQIAIGRLDSNDVVFASDLAVSRNHAVIERYDFGWRVRDLRSSNGTFVNGIRVSGTMGVKDNDRITVGGSHMTFRSSSPVVSGLTTIRPSNDLPTGPLFSEREREILRLVAEGDTDAEIAEQLTVSVKTVHSHLDRIRNKAGVRRRAELTRMAVALGIVKDS